MNTISRYAVWAAALTFMAVSASCGANNSKNSTESSSFTTEGISWSDSLKVNSCSSKVNITVAYPETGNAALLDSIRTWIVRNLEASVSMNTTPTDTVIDPAALADGKQLIANAGKMFLDFSKQDFEDVGEETGFAFNYQLQANISNTYKTDSVVTFVCDTYTYTGGAHGSSITSPSSFKVSDGTQIDYSIFNPNALGELTQMVKEALAKQYFDNGDDYKMEDALIIDPQDISLPVFPPYFTEKGLTFIYQEYEITCYAAGSPTCTIPYSEVAPLMTSAGRKLIP